MTDVKLREYQSFNRLIKTLTRIVGLWPKSKPSFFYRSLPFVNMAVCMAIIYFIMTFVVINISNINVMTKGLGLGTSFMNTILKIMCVAFNYKDLVELHETLQPLFDKLLSDKQIRELILPKISGIRRLSSVMMHLIGLSILTFILKPAITILHRKRLANSTDFSADLSAAPAIYPWSINSVNFYFFCQYVFECYTGFLLFCVTTGVDSLFLFYIFQMMSQLRAMSNRLDILTMHDDYVKVIADCVLKYQKLMRCRDILESIYGPIILWMLLTSAVVLCALTFQISQVEHVTAGHILLFVGYTGSKMLQTYLYAWGGSILTSASEELEESIYATDWPGSGKLRFMTSILIMLSQKPLVLTACSYTVVSVDMFAMVMNTTVSYFFLLQTMDEKTK
uniref:Odorant receptor n=1 Tax=Aulacocentrum confusum TaxID=2767324 RepID=A0A7G8Z946_9HYME|nr:olfactory receptor 27 [Aulacocentrum confusum]